MDKLFIYEGFQIRTKTDDEEQVWFVGIDVCNVLGYADSHQKITKSLDDDEYKLDRITDGQGKQKDTLTVNEFGLYSLILSSQKPEAKVFRRWVTHEVLPAIRKAGRYTSEEEKEREESIQDFVKKIEELEEKRSEHLRISNETKKEIETMNAELRALIKSDFRQRKLSFID